MARTPGSRPPRAQRATPIGTIAVEPSDRARTDRPRTPTTPTHAYPAMPDGGVRLAEVLVALSSALDLAEGQSLGHTVRSAHIGMRLAEEVGVGEAERAALYYALILKDLGGSANASRVAALFAGDDREVKPLLRVADWARPLPRALATFRAAAVGRSAAARLRQTCRLWREEGVARELIRLRSDRGAELVAAMGFPGETIDAVRYLDEHWDGSGHPDGLIGDATPILARIAALAQALEIHHTRGGVDGALRMARARRNRWFDPALVDVVLGWRNDRDWWRRLASPDSADRLVAAEPGAKGPVLVDDAGLDLVARTFAEVVDAKSPFTERHSVLVAAYADVIAEGYGLDAEARRQLRRAGLLHDIGKLGISNRLLDKTGGLAPEERQAMERHPLHTWEILSRVRAFAGLARTAALHHEKLDGSGYPWRVPGDRLPAAARVLVVADTIEALTARRPFRRPLEVDEVIGILRRDRTARLCPRAVDAAEAVLADGRLVIGSDAPLERAGIPADVVASTGSSAAA